jgi:hypothetical protein
LFAGFCCLSRHVQFFISQPSKDWGISPGLAQAATIIAEMSPGGDLEGDVPYLILAFFGCLFPYQH